MKKHIKVYYEALFGRGFDSSCQMQAYCEVCSKPCKSVHHMLYLSQGGKDVIDNLMGLCVDCHDRAHFKKDPHLNYDRLRGIHRDFLIDICKK